MLRLVSTVVAPTSICLRLGGWANAGRRLESFIFRSEIRIFLTISADCTQHLHGNEKRKYVQDNILQSALGSSHAGLVFFAFRGNPMLYPAGERHCFWQWRYEPKKSRLFNAL